MEETSGAVHAPFGESPFGESPFGELISAWLDEGDRLSASAAALVAPSAAAESRFRHVLQRLQPVFARHRLLVLAGIGLLPVALILSMYRGASAQPPAATVALAAPVARPAAVEPRPAAQSAPAPALALASIATAIATPAPASLARAGSADSKAAPNQHHHHHHHHHAASAPNKSVAPSGRATRR
jgi:hypothetical protein